MKFSFIKNLESEFSDKESKSNNNKKSDRWEGRGLGCG